MDELKMASLWQRLSSSLESQLNTPLFEGLLSSAKPLSLEKGTLQVSVPNEFTRGWLNEHCTPILDGLMKDFKGQGIKGISFVVVPKEEEPPKQKSEAPIEEPVAVSLNPRYTFDSFVVGHGNRFAHAAALAVAETPAKAYNPLFVYGGVGLGKTHLMQAIGHFILKARPQSKVAYITSERFTNELINSIRDDRMEGFRNHYRTMDILLIDDIHFIAGKERTQEEFFHTFNTLYEAGKQIVLSSDRPPKEIPTLEERLRSRFEWGLTADIQAPDLETRIAILKKKAESQELIVPNDVLEFIAQKLTKNIRELEGALIRTVAYASLHSQGITLEMAEKSLKDFVVSEKGKPQITIDLIKKVAAEYYSVKFDDMAAKIRTKEIATARQVAMYLARELTSASLPKIGKEFGGRDHTTVMHACDKIKEGIKRNSEIEEAIKSIASSLQKYSP